ncbi:MAG: nucleoside phosphorylase [Clostridia bacterium]|nr:nucleoside phosphorylase [Clostridia bacterium]
MAVHKHPIPILEYDDNPNAVIMPDHAQYSFCLPEVAVFAFLGNTIDRYAARMGLEVIGHFETITKIFPVYRMCTADTEICLCQAPQGAAASVQFLDWLIGYGVKKIITAGSCWALTDLPENVFLVPARALRDEGASYHYLPPERFVETDPTVRDAIETVLRERGLPYIECTTWTTDGFFRETREKVEYRKAEGCSTVEMECAGLAACARFRGAAFGQILYTADSLAHAEKYDERDWGEASLEPALQLCIDVAERL